MNCVNRGDASPSPVRPCVIRMAAVEKRGKNVEKMEVFRQTPALFANIDQDGNEVQALHDINFDVAEGEFVCIVGPSGCGKSTLLEIVAGLLDATSGEVLLDGQPVHGTSRDIGVVFQDASLFPWRTVRKNVAFGLEIAGVPREEREERLKRYISMVSLNGFENKYPAQLSGGMRQRAGIARTLAMNPKVILMAAPCPATAPHIRCCTG